MANAAVITSMPMMPCKGKKGGSYPAKAVKKVRHSPTMTQVDCSKIRQTKKAQLTPGKVNAQGETWK